MQCIYHCPLPLPPPTRPLCACKMCSNKTICKFCNNISFYGCRFCYYSTYTAAFSPSSSAANRVCSSFTSSVLGLGQSLTPCSPSVQYIWVSPEPHELFIVKSWAKTGREERETRPGNRQWRNFLFVPFHGHCFSEPLLWSHWNECGCSMHSSREMCVLELWSMWLGVHPFCMATKKCQFFIVTRFWK